MATLRFLFHDHLNQSIATLVDCDKRHDVVLMCESRQEFTRVKHHQKKIAFWIASMRHFHKQLKDQGYRVDYVALDDPQNSHDFSKEVLACAKRHHLDQVVIMQPSDYFLDQKMRQLADKSSLAVTMLPDNRFLASDDFFVTWASGKKQLRMEFFYREMRKAHSILMDNGEPVGGKWNYDSENRKPPKSGLTIPATYNHPPDAISKAACALVADTFSDHFGEITPFYFAVTREQALEALALFIRERLINFGDYQDAMLQGEPWMYHSHIGFYINIGFLHPRECIEAAETAYQQGLAPLNAVEGFIRQILGWREFIRGIYWHKMPDYAEMNFLDAQRALPDFYWSAKTDMNCLRQCVAETKQHAYAHHIQRLMVLGNFALIAGLHPKHVNEWYHIVYADAYQWVELPNVSGMILFADGGYLGSKPYAASGAYIDKMSDYCKGCRFNVKEKNGPDACPFNYLYWDFLLRNQDKLRSNQRLGMIYGTLSRMQPERIAAIQSDSAAFLDQLSQDADDG